MQSPKNEHCECCCVPFSRCFSFSFMDCLIGPIMCEMKMQQDWDLSNTEPGLFSPRQERQNKK